MAELQGLGAITHELEAAGAEPDLAATRRWGLVQPRGGPEGQDVPRPATVVIDREGIVRWFSVSRNFQVRPDPSDVLRAVRAL